MIAQTSPSFAEWLQTQLRARRMSQRQLADRSGVDHSTISRLTRSERVPSLDTATKLAEAFGSLHPDSGVVPHLALMERGPANPLAWVERALRSDDLLGEEQVRQVMRLYLAVRRPRISADRTDADRPAALRLEVPGAG
jgi:transcriptional regulator with XRE-family HTH domain